MFNTDADVTYLSDEGVRRITVCSCVLAIIPLFELLTLGRWRKCCQEFNWGGFLDAINSKLIQVNESCVKNVHKNNKPTQNKYLNHVPSLGHLRVLGYVYDIAYGTEPLHHANSCS